MKRFPTMIALATLAAGVAAALAQENPVPAKQLSPGEAAIQKAAAANKYAFVFFWKEKDERTDQAWGALKTAAAKSADRADVVAVKATDPAEKTLVERYQMTRAPLPMVLAIAPCGAITKAILKTADEKQLHDAFVSPGTALCMKHLQAKKLVVLCVSPKAPQVQQVSLQQGVKDFTEDADYAGNVEVVHLNAGDAAEAGFLKDLKVDPRTAAPVTVLMAPPATVVVTLSGEVTKEQLVAKLKAAQSGCCCPGGKCCPGGCCPQH